jgi:hypothetical protein
MWLKNMPKEVRGLVKRVGARVGIHVGPKRFEDLLAGRCELRSRQKKAQQRQDFLPDLRALYDQISNANRDSSEVFDIDFRRKPPAE